MDVSQLCIDVNHSTSTESISVNTDNNNNNNNNNNDRVFNDDNKNRGKYAERYIKNTTI